MRALLVYLRVIGYILFYGCGVYLFVISLMFYYALWGIWGVIGSFILFPAAEVFPIVAWIVTKEFPLLLFLVWILGWVGMILVGISTRGRDS